MICTELRAEKMKTLHSNAAAIKRILFFSAVQISVVSF